MNSCLFIKLVENIFQDWLSCMCVGLCCENGQGYPVWLQSKAISHLQAFIYFSSSFWKGKLRKFFSIPFTSRDGLLTWRCWRYSDKKRFLYLCDFFSAKYDLTFYVWWECYYFQVAEMLQIPLGEVSVRWQEIDGSKLSPLLAAIEMFRLLHLTSHVTNWWYLLFSGISSCCGWDMPLAPGEFQRRKPDCSCIWDPDEEGPWFNNLFCLTKKTALGPYIALGNLHTFSEPFHWSSYHHRGCINCDTNIYWYWYVWLYHFTEYLPCAFCKFLKYFHVCLFRDC